MEGGINNKTIIKDNDKNNEQDIFFPFKAYPSQKKFMTAMLNALKSNKRIGLFESPTGTGKTLMILCSIMTYLYGNTQANTDTKENIGSDNDWLSAFGKSPTKPLIDLNEGIRTYRHHNTFLKPAIPKKKLKQDKMLIKAYIQPNPILLSKIQVIFCTRTHSQISQVIAEAKRIRDYYHLSQKGFFPFSFTVLGSRKYLCINTSLNKTSTASSMLNSKCKELMDDSACPHYSPEAIDILSKDIVNKIMDIEDLCSLSQSISSCPYYASHKAIEMSDFILMPYNSILIKSIRSNLGITLKGKVIVFDEAHNIIDSLLQSYSCELTSGMVLSVTVALVLYYDTYSNRLKAENNLLIRQLISICERLLEFIDKYTVETKDRSVIQLTDFTIKSNTTSYDLFKLRKFIEEAEMKEKLQWTIENFLTSQRTTDELKNIVTKYQPKLSRSFRGIESVQSLLKTLIGKESVSRFSLFINGLTHIDDDGVIILSNNELKFQMINPKTEFESIITEAKCVIFAGGTLKPFDDFSPLFTSLSSDLIEIYEGDHVILADSVQVSIIQSNPFTSDKENLTFTYDQFKSQHDFLIEIMLKTIKAYLNELNAIFKSNESKDNRGRGIAVFVPSYDLLSRVIKANNKLSIISNDTDSLFYEHSESNTTPFDQYKKSILKNKHNSVLIAIIGGKLSEGINFNDDLARIVLVFGLPYPNINSMEIKQKMKYYDRLFKTKVLNTNGNEYYENLCIKAVNQTIGRAIRHSKDYAAIVLVDWRYTKTNIEAKLPKWLKHKVINRISNSNGFKHHMEDLKVFLNKDC